MSPAIYPQVLFVCRTCLADALESADARGVEFPYRLGRQLEPEEGPEPCEWCGVGVVWDEVLYRPKQEEAPPTGG
jgi:hypothetical protein